MIVDAFEGERLRYAVMPRVSAMDATFSRPYAFVSITDPGQSDRPCNRASPFEYGAAELMEAPSLVAVHRSEFYDVPFDVGHYKAMAPEAARGIADFLSDVLPRVQVLAVHCELGASRSPSVVQAVWEWLEDAPSPLLHSERFSLNPAVLERMREALAGRARPW